MQGRGTAQPGGVPAEGRHKGGVRACRGGLKKATKNRFPVLLAAVIGRTMVMGRERSELRAQQASRKRKR